MIMNIDQTQVYHRMETLEDTDNITKNIVREIVRECSADGVIIDENFCVYYVKLLSLHPQWGISPECQLNRENVQHLVNYCIEKLKDLNNPRILALKIQHYFMSQATGKLDMIIAHKISILQLLAPLKEEIFNFQCEENNKAQEQKLCKKMVVFITLLSGMGNPTQAAVAKDVTLALQSILDDIDFFKFTHFKKDDKEDQLIRLTNLVTGIRIFNRDSGKTSAGIEDLPKVVFQGLASMKGELQRELLHVMEQVNILTHVIEKCYECEKKGKGMFTLNIVVQDINLVLHQESLIVLRQLEVYIRKILAEVTDINDCCTKILQRLDFLLTKLHSIIKFKIAVPITQVFPLFIDLAETSFQLQDQAILLAKFNCIYIDLIKQTEKINITQEQYKSILNNESVLTDAKRLDKMKGMKIKQSGNKCEILDASDLEIHKMRLEYLGFCPWSLVETTGALIPGNPNIGVCRYNSKYYVFSCLEAAESFGKNPERYIMGILTVARHKQQLIYFLQLQNEMKNVREIVELYEKTPEQVLTIDIEMQTEIHPVKSFIVPEYKWNVWDLYRDAIHLANIAKCMTHANQTYTSHFRSPAWVQTHENRDKMCQTKHDNYTNTPTLSNYIFGLRGRKDANQHIVTLTRPVDEWNHGCNPPMQ